MGRDRRRKMIATANATKERETQKETWGGAGGKMPGKDRSNGSRGVLLK